MWYVGGVNTDIDIVVIIMVLAVGNNGRWNSMWNIRLECANASVHHRPRATEPPSPVLSLAHITNNQHNLPFLSFHFPSKPRRSHCPPPCPATPSSLRSLPSSSSSHSPSRSFRQRFDHTTDTLLLPLVSTLALTSSPQQLDAITSQSPPPGAPASRTPAVPIPHRNSSPPVPLSSSFSHPQILSSSPSTSAFGISPPGGLAGRLPSKSFQQDREKVLYPQRVILTSESRFPASYALS